MREIKLRAKRKCDGKWVYATLEIGWTGTFQLVQKTADGMFNCSELEKDTVGQFTGFKDVSGKEIYEGHIIVYTNKAETKFEVRFEDGSFGVFTEYGRWGDLRKLIAFCEYLEYTIRVVEITNSSELLESE